MRIVGIDIESDGLDPAKNRIIELSAVLWDWDTKTPLRMISEFVDPSFDVEVNGFTIPQEITDINGITNDMLAVFGEHERDVIRKVARIFEEGDAAYFMGHFATDFDALFFKTACGRIFPPIAVGVVGYLHDRPWLDTAVDIKYPPSIKTRNLKHLAAEYGFVAPFSHRSLFDVLTMLRIASHFPLEGIIARAAEPTVYVQAQVSYAENQKAKDFQFRWNPEKKVWWKALKQSDFEEEKGKYEFKFNLFDPGLFKMEG